jgi:microcystin-dependent protein
MAKTTFTNNVSKIFAPFLNLIFTHVHDGTNYDGHVSKIDLTTGNNVTGKLPQDMCLAVPIGTIFPYIGATIPVGYLQCHGEEFSSGTYPALATLLGSNTLPDLRNRFILCVGEGNPLKTIGGESTHTLTEAELASHSHSFKNGAGSSVGLGIDSGSEGASYKIPDASTANTFVNVAASGSGSPHNNMPPYYALNYIIRAI